MAGLEQPIHGSNDPGFPSRPPPEIHPHQKEGAAIFALYGPNRIRDRDGWSNAVQVTAQHGDSRGEQIFRQLNMRKPKILMRKDRDLQKGESGGTAGGKGRGTSK